MTVDIRWEGIRTLSIQPKHRQLFAPACAIATMHTAVRNYSNECSPVSSVLKTDLDRIVWSGSGFALSVYCMHVCLCALVCFWFSIIFLWFFCLAFRWDWWAFDVFALICGINFSTPTIWQRFGKLVMRKRNVYEWKHESVMNECICYSPAHLKYVHPDYTCSLIFQPGRSSKSFDKSHDLRLNGLLWRRWGQHMLGRCIVG